MKFGNKKWPLIYQLCVTYKFWFHLVNIGKLRSAYMGIIYQRVLWYGQLTWFFFFSNFKSATSMFNKYRTHWQWDPVITPFVVEHFSVSFARSANIYLHNCTFSIKYRNFSIDINPRNFRYVHKCCTNWKSHEFCRTYDLKLSMKK